MAEFDFVTILGPTLISAIIAFIILGLQRLTRQGDDTTTHTVKVQNIEIKVTGFERKFEDIDHKFNDVWRRINEDSAKISLHEYRLDRLDKNGQKSAV